MALSNIFREPRREITETIVGLAITAALLSVDYRFGAWVHAATIDSPGGPIPTMIGMFLGVLAIFATGLFIAFGHFLGEEICDSLARRGLELRPKIRR